MEISVRSLLKKQYTRSCHSSQLVMAAIVPLRNLRFFSVSEDQNKKIKVNISVNFIQYICNAAVVVINIGISFARQATRCRRHLSYTTTWAGYYASQKKKNRNSISSSMFIIRRIQRYIFQSVKYIRKVMMIFVFYIWILELVTKQLIVNRPLSRVPGASLGTKDEIRYLLHF